MKKYLVLFLSALIVLVLVAGCSDKPGDAPQTDTPTVSEDLNEGSVKTDLKGKLYEAEKFTIIAPKGWEVLEFTDADGFQLYKSSGEAIQVQYAGYNQGDGAAKQDVEQFAKNYDGTEAIEIEMLGKNFWVTYYEFSGDEQALYARIEDGVKLSIQTVKGNYENNEEYRAILDSIVFK